MSVYGTLPEIKQLLNINAGMEIHHPLLLPLHTTMIIKTNDINCL